MNSEIKSSSFDMGNSMFDITFSFRYDSSIKVFLSLMRKFIRGFGFAFKGIWHAAATQLNFRVHLVAALIAIFAGFTFHLSIAEWLWIIFCIGMVLTAELFNTAIEFLTDLVSPEYNKKAGLVKDMSAGAVLITAITALISGLIIFGPKLLAFFPHAA